MTYLHPEDLPVHVDFVRVIRTNGKTCITAGEDRSLSALRSSLTCAIVSIIAEGAT